jgi:protein-disulfide isomerase
MSRFVALLVPLASCWTSPPPQPPAPAPPPAAPPVADKAVEVVETGEEEGEEELPPPTYGKVYGTAVQPRPQPDPAKTYAVTLDHAWIDGPADAKVTLVVAGEYACPFTDKLQPVLGALRAKYGADLRIAYRQYVVHPRDATPYALAICAADKQRKAPALDPLLWNRGFKVRQFDKPIDLPDGTKEDCWTVAAGCPLSIDLMRAAGIDIARAKVDMATTCVAELKQGIAELAALGVSGTPATYVNGRILVGARPTSDYEVLIDEELAKADDRIRRGTKRARYYQQWVIDAGATVP